MNGVNDMKKRSVVNLIKYYSENNPEAFRNEAMDIAREFDREGDPQLAEYIISLLTNVNTFIPQVDETMVNMFEKVKYSNENLWLPEAISKELMGIVNAVSYRNGINKFLFQGMPGTGKTEAVKQIARILKREIYMVNFSNIVDSKLGNTGKNIAELFKEINHFPHPEQLIILFDEIDAIALDRTNAQDHREMGRATSGILREMDRMSPDIIMIATTNLYKYFDKALLRRFDAVISFDCYSEEDLLEIGEKFLDIYAREFHLMKKDVRIFRKIFAQRQDVNSPGELKNSIKTAIAFSDPGNEGDYLRRLYANLCGNQQVTISELKDQGFTVREIGILTDKSKSSVDRELKEVK